MARSKAGKSNGTTTNPAAAAANPATSGAIPVGVVKTRTLAVPSEAEIRLRAYHIYLERGNRPGSPDADWLQAEWELKQRAGSAAPKPVRVRTSVAR